MEAFHKELYLTNEMDKAIKAKANGKYVALCLPIIDIESTAEINMNDFPYCIENLDEVGMDYLDRILHRLKGEPCEILRTEKCILREITCEDVQSLYEIYDDDEVRANMEELYPNHQKEIDYTKDYIHYQYGFYDFGMWIIEDIKTGKVIGRAGLDLIDEKRIREGKVEELLLYGLEDISYHDAEFPVELGFVMKKEYRQKGLTYDICKEILKYADENISYATIYSRVKKENVASRQLLKKLNFFEIRY